MSLVQHVTSSDFESIVLQSDVPVLVDFWAPWCGPCRVVGPILDEISEEYKDKVSIVKVDVDVEGNGEIASRYSVRGIPTLILFKDGGPIRTSVGALSKAQIMELLEQAFEGTS